MKKLLDFKELGLLTALAIVLALAGCPWDDPEAETPLIRIEATVTHRFEGAAPFPTPPPFDPNCLNGVNPNTGEPCTPCVNGQNPETGEPCEENEGPNG